jgi:hypothetical protein
MVAPCAPCATGRALAGERARDAAAQSFQTLFAPVRAYRGRMGDVIKQALAYVRSVAQSTRISWPSSIVTVDFVSLD